MTEEPLLKSGASVNDDLGVEIRYYVYSHRMHFKSRCRTVQPDGSVIYYGDDEASELCNLPTDQFDEANRLVDGYVKWDGCSHVHFGDLDSDGYMHMCGGVDFAIMLWVLREVPAIAAREMPNFSEHVAGFKRVEASA